MPRKKQVFRDGRLPIKKNTQHGIFQFDELLRRFKRDKIHRAEPNGGNERIRQKAMQKLNRHWHDIKNCYCCKNVQGRKDKI